jgi:hypothetical protein
MKHFLRTIVLCAVTTLPALAQQSGPLELSTAKTTALKKRLIAGAGYSVDGPSPVKRDSARYQFGGDRAGVFSPFVGDDDGMNSYDTITNFNAALMPSVRNFQEFTTDDKVLRTTSQTMSGGSWVNNQRWTYTYLPSGMQGTITGEVWNTGASSWENKSFAYYKYNAADKLDTSVSMSWNAGAASWTLNGRNTYTYNAAGLTETLLSMTYSGGTWINSNKISYTYDASGLKIKELQQIADAGGILQDATQRIYTYNAAGHTTDILLQQPKSGVWTDMRHSVTTYDAAGYPSAEIGLTVNATTGALDTISKTDYILTSDHLVAGTIAYARSGGTLKVSMHRYFYYEEFSPSGMPEIATGSKGSLVLFPVPAKNALNLELQWDQPQQATVAIADLNGRVWKQWTLPAMQIYTGQVQIDELPAGTYFLSCYGAQNGKQVQAFTVSR